MPFKLLKSQEEAEALVDRLRKRGIAATLFYKEVKIKGEYQDRWKVIWGERAAEHYRAILEDNPYGEPTGFGKRRSAWQILEYELGRDQGVTKRSYADSLMEAKEIANAISGAYPVDIYNPDSRKVTVVRNPYRDEPRIDKPRYRLEEDIGGKNWITVREGWDLRELEVAEAAERKIHPKRKYRIRRVNPQSVHVRNPVNVGNPEYGPTPFSPLAEGSTRYTIWARTGTKWARESFATGLRKAEIRMANLKKRYKRDDWLILPEGKVPNEGIPCIRVVRNYIPV